MNEPGNKAVHLATAGGRMALRSVIAVLAVAAVLLYPPTLAIVAGVMLVVFFLRLDRLH